MKGTAFFSFILVVWFASSEVQAFNITVQEGEPISNAIYNATLHLPDFWFIFTGFNVSVTNLTCTNTTVDRIEGQIFGLIDPNPNMPFTVFLDLYIPSISLNCTANWYYKTSPITSSSGDMILSIGDNTNLAVQISAHQNISQASATPSPSPSISPTNSISISSTPTPSTTPSSPPASQTSSNTPSISITPTKSTTSTQSGSIIPTNTTTMAFAKQGVHAKEMPIQFNPNRQELEESVAQQIVQKAIFQYLEKDVNAYAKQALKVQEDDSSAPDSPPVAPHWEFESQCAMNATITYLYTSSFTLNTLIPKIIDAVEPLIPGLVCDQVHDIVTTEIETAGNAVIQQLYNEAYILNSGNPGFVFNKDAFLYAFLGAGILFFLMFFFLLVIPTMIEIYNEHKRAVQGEFQSLIVNQPSTHSMDSVVLPAENTSAMIMDKRLAWYWRYALLFVVLYNVALFATSTVSVASNVYLYITVGTKIIRLPSLYSFMIVTSVVEMWNAGVWPLSLLIAVASGIWPYVKLVIMFFLMLIPPKYLSPKWRKRILRVLDALGKWSLIDVYVLVLFINAFRIHIPLGDNVAIDMAVEPQYAFFAYLLATVTSLILTHVFLYVHDELEEPAIPENGKMEQLYNHRFHYGSRRFVLTIFGKILVPIVIIIAAVGVISGSSVYAFEFDWSGSLAGSALVATGQDITKNFSVFSLLLDIPGTAYNQQSGAGVRTVQCTYALFVLAIPLLHLAALFVVWVTPLTMQMQRGFYILIEVLSAWAAMDVFIVALIVALLELQQFADYLIDGKCNGIEYLLSLVPGAPQTCFTVKASLKSGSWILVLAVIVLLVVGYSVMYICNKAIRERKDKEIKHLQKMGSMSDFYAPDRSISIVTKGIVHTFKAIMCIRFL